VDKTLGACLFVIAHSEWMISGEAPSFRVFETSNLLCQVDNL
jgi:hypothetical protein